MTCTQRNSLVFMTSTFILFLQIQIYSVNSYHHHHHQHQQQQKQEHHHSHHHNDNNHSYLSSQYNHLRHHHYVPLRSREQVHHKATANNATPFRSVDEINAFNAHAHTTKYSVKNHTYITSQNNHNNNNVGGNRAVNNSNKNSTLRTHHQSNNNHRRYIERNASIAWNRNSLFQYETPKAGYQIKSSGSKVHSDRFYQHPMSTTKIIKITTARQRNWESQKRNHSQLPQSFIRGGEHDSNTSEIEDYYDDEVDNDDGDDEDKDEDDVDGDGDEDNDEITQSTPFKLLKPKFTSTPETIKDLHDDLSYDYLYDEPINDTDKESGSLTEEKWRNYGTAEAVEKSRRRHLSEAQIIAAHITRINMEAMCKYPRPKIIQINEASKRYVPHCTVLHRCGDDTGCCHSETQTCVAKKTITVDLHFYAIPLKTKDPIVEVLSFVNHTECHCVDRFPIRGSTHPPDSNLLDGRNSKNGTCNCIRHFDIFEDNIDDETDYQQSDISKNLSICRCDCTSDNLTCQRLKRGQEGIPVDDRRCILEGRCNIPTCEHGIYNRYLGRCPRTIVKRTIATGKT